MRAAGVKLSIDDFERIRRRTPHLADTKPAGRFVATDLHRVGGVPLVMKMLLEAGLLHGDAPHPPTFRLFDRTYGPDPVACDFVFVSGSLKPRVKRLVIDGVTRVSDHQPVMVEFGRD
jgi:hypothetical protein